MAHRKYRLPVRRFFLSAACYVVGIIMQPAFPIQSSCAESSPSYPYNVKTRSHLYKYFGHIGQHFL